MMVNSDLTVAALLDHEAETKFQKKTQQHQVRPTFIRPGGRQAAVLNSLISADKAGLTSCYRRIR
jgi:hypothetical protein